MTSRRRNRQQVIADRNQRERDHKNEIHALNEQIKLANDRTASAFTENARLRADLHDAKNLRDPVAMILHCPECGSRHVDDPNGRCGDAMPGERHHTHACRVCGLTWRPSINPTIGVRFLPGFGPATTATSERPQVATGKERLSDFDDTGDHLAVAPETLK